MKNEQKIEKNFQQKKKKPSLLLQTHVFFIQ